MASINSIKQKISNLIASANETTAAGDTTITSAVNTLISGYGQGGGGSDPLYSLNNAVDNTFWVRNQQQVFTLYPTSSSLKYSAYIPITGYNSSVAGTNYLNSIYVPSNFTGYVDVYRAFYFSTASTIGYYTQSYYQLSKPAESVFNDPSGGFGASLTSYSTVYSCLPPQGFTPPYTANNFSRVVDFIDSFTVETPSVAGNSLNSSFSSAAYNYNINVWVSRLADINYSISLGRFPITRYALKNYTSTANLYPVGYYYSPSITSSAYMLMSAHRWEYFGKVKAPETSYYSNGVLRFSGELNSRNYSSIFSATGIPDNNIRITKIPEIQFYFPSTDGIQYLASYAINRWASNVGCNMSIRQPTDKMTISGYFPYSNTYYPGSAAAIQVGNVKNLVISPINRTYSVAEQAFITELYTNPTLETLEVDARVIYWLSRCLLSNCRGIKSVKILYNSSGAFVPTVSGSGEIFLNTPFNTSSYTGEFASLYVPSSLLNSYKTANRWSLYADRMVGY